ncbi:hypothetical protein ACIQCF_08090 [Streptomyces sp. NPDC088353]|uniref:hypothetical protein n=1 Tax=Streptomyces sp. NPDC088353 TaxID=3365855 RepID=UPI003825FEC2
MIEYAVTAVDPVSSLSTRSTLLKTAELHRYGTPTVVKYFFTTAVLILSRSAVTGFVTRVVQCQLP